MSEVKFHSKNQSTCQLCGSNFYVCLWNLSVWPFKWTLLSSAFMWYSLCCTRWFHIFSLNKAQAIKQYCYAAFHINLPCKNRALKLVSLDNWRVAILVIPLYLLANIKGSVSNLTFHCILKIFVSFRHRLSLLPVTNAFMVYCAESNQAILFWFGFTTVWDWLSSLIGKYLVWFWFYNTQ